MPTPTLTCFAFTDPPQQEFRPNPTAFFSADISVAGKDGGCEGRVIARHADAASAERHGETGFHSGRGRVAEPPGALAATLKD